MSFKTISGFFVAAAAMLLMASCSKKSNTQGRYIPANAAVVVLVNSEAISAKLPWEEVKQNELFKSLYADSSITSLVKAALDNPENTGIDTKKDMLFFLMKDSTGGYVVFEGAIKDAAKFKTYNAAALKNAAASEKNGIQYLAEKGTTVSWDKDKFIVIADAPDMNQVNNFDPSVDRDSLPMPVPAPVKVFRDGVSTAAALYALAENKSMAKDEKFSKLVGKKGDIHFWMNTQALYEGNEGMASMSMVNLRKLYEDSFTAGTVNFENGQVNVDILSYAGKEMANLWKKYGGTKLNSDFSNRFAAQNVAAFFAMNFKPEGIKEFVKLLGVDGFINMGTAFLGFNLDDFVKANKGDILLALSDITKDTAGKTSANFIFAATVNDKASFDKLVAAGSKMGKDQLGSDASKLFYNRNDPYFAIGNNKTAVDNFVSKTGNAQLAFLNKIASSPIAGYANLQYIFSSMKETATKDSLGMQALDLSSKLWKDVTLNGGDFEDGGVTQHIEINLQDKSTNSLKQLNTYFGSMGAILKQKKQEPNINDLRLPGNFPSGIDTSALYE
jgi:Domain of unknown function (DUF4836)